MKIIDAHLHLVENDPRYFNQIALEAGHVNTVEHLESEYRRLNIVGGVVMGNRGLEPERHQYPSYLRYCIGVDQIYLSHYTEKHMLDMIEYHLTQPQCAGIKLYPGYNETYITDDIYVPIYQLAEHYHKLIAIHTGQTAGASAILKYSHPLTVDEIAVRYPKLQFVMCHFGNPWLTDAAAVVSKNPNVAADVSGLLEGMVNVPELCREKHYYLDMLKGWFDYISYDRLMFGTDWPLVNLENYIDFIKAVVPDKYQESVFYGNAARIYHFE